MAKIAKFSTRKASETILKIMRQMGLKTRKPGNDTWINHAKGESVICIGCNSIRISVTENGVSFRSSHALFGDWSHRSKSFRRFNQQMGHVLFYYN